MKEAVKHADAALGMDLLDRREKFCFLTRFSGKWGLPWDLDLANATDDEEEEGNDGDNAKNITATEEEPNPEEAKQEE